MNCVESRKEIGTNWNLILLPSQKLISDFYDKPFIKLSGQVSSDAVIVLSKAVETVVEVSFKYPVFVLNGLVFIL